MSINVVHIITDLGIGGAETTLYRLISSSLSSVNHSVISLSETVQDEVPIRQLNVPVYVLNLSGTKFSLLSLYSLYKLLRKLEPDVVQTWMYHSDLIGGLAARCAGIKNIIWGVRNLSLKDTSLRTKSIVAASSMLSYVLPRYIVTPSRKAKLLHEKIGYSCSKFVVIPNGFDINIIKFDKNGRDRLRREWKVPDGEVLLGCVARWHPHKDHENLIDALEKTKNVRCVLVGKGVEQAPENRRLIIAGIQSDIAAVMSAIDIHVLPSSSEAFPNVVAEAMACGTPCIVTDVGDGPFIVGATGWIVPPRDSNALASVINTSLMEYTTKSAACRRRIEDNFSIEKMVNDYRSLWEMA